VERIAANLPTMLCLLVTAAVVIAAVMVVRTRRRRVPDTTGWAPAQATVVARQELVVDDQPHAQLTVEFQTWRGQVVRFTDQVPVWQVQYGTTLGVIYDPDDPLRAQVVRRHRPHG